MSRYRNDRRVRWHGEDYATVTAADEFAVSFRGDLGGWKVQRTADSFMTDQWWGPYPSADEAIAAVLTCNLPVMRYRRSAW
jgi:hypothetical protein